MFNYRAWLKRGNAPDTAIRAAQAWQRIQQKPTTIIAVRAGSPLPEQTVRIEVSNGGQTEAKGSAGISSKQTVIVFGVLGLPGMTDVDLEHGDLFAVNNVQYRVISVTRVMGELQATAEALT